MTKLINLDQSWPLRAGALIAILCFFSAIPRVDAAPNHSHYKATATASSVYSSDFPAGHAIDGDRRTRWCSSEPYGKREWLQLDLGEEKPIGRVEIFWEVAYGRGYQLSTSNDAKDWKVVFKSGAGDGHRDVLSDLKASGRYLRLDCLERGSWHGFSIWEMEVYPEAASAADDVVKANLGYQPPAGGIPTMEFVADKNYLLVPVKNGTPVLATQCKIWLTVGDREIGPYDVVMSRSAADVDWYGHFPLEHFKGERVEVRGQNVTEETFALIRQSDTIPGEEEFYNEVFRPQFHFTARTGWLNDPNGLIYHNGKYHMYFQHNPFSVKWGNMSWGHAVSVDMIHWEEEPVVLFPNAQGSCFSGASFIDRNNQLGLKTGKEDVMVAFYLRTKIGLAYAYSNDGGHSFSDYEGNPVLTHAGARIDTPRPFFHEPTKRWVAPTYDFFDNDEGTKLRCVGFYSSADLRDWRFESRVEQDKWGDELCGCVDFFQLPVDPPSTDGFGGTGGDPDNPPSSRKRDYGATNKKWVMIMIDGSYIIGDFDGKTFFNLEGKPAITKDRIRSLVVKHNFYATMTWHDAPDGRRVQVTWMQSGHHFPGTPYGQQMTLPSELTLHSTPEGPRLRMNPIREFESLRKRTEEFQDVVLKAGDNPLSDIKGELFDLEVEFRPSAGSVTVFDMRGIPVRYAADSGELSCGPAKTTLAPVDGKIRLRIIQDRTCIEVYGNEGRVYIPVVQAPEQGNPGLEARCEKGEVRAKFLRVHKLRSAWSK